MNEIITDEVEDQEQAFSNGYMKALDKLLKQGYKRRKAIRYLDSVAKRNLKKFIKKTKKAGQLNTIQTKEPSTFDPSEEQE